MAVAATEKAADSAFLFDRAVNKMSPERNNLHQSQLQSSPSSVRIQIVITATTTTSDIYSAAVPMGGHKSGQKEKIRFGHDSAGKRRSILATVRPGSLVSRGGVAAAVFFWDNG